MGRIAEILSFTRKLVNGVNTSDVKINPDGGSNITVPHFASPGDDSVPLTTDSVVTTEVQGTGNEAAVGYIDPINTPKSLPGEKRIYGRDANGAEVSEIYLKNDGSILMSNANGSMELQSGGDVVINGVTITVGGDVVSAGGKSLETHTHPAGTPPGNTGTPN